MPNTRGKSRKVLDSLLGDRQEPSNHVNKEDTKGCKTNFKGKARSKTGKTPPVKRKRSLSRSASRSPARGSKNPGSAKRKSTEKVTATFFEDNQYVSMSAEGQETEFVDSEEDLDGEISFKNSQSSHTSNQLESPVNDGDGENDKVNSKEERGPGSSDEERNENENAQIYSSDESNDEAETEKEMDGLSKEDYQVFKRVQQLMAKEGFKESANFLRNHMKGEKKAGGVRHQSEERSQAKGVGEKTQRKHGSSSGNGLDQPNSSNSETTIYDGAVKRNSSSSEDDEFIPEVFHDLHDYVSGNPTPSSQRRASSSHKTAQNQQQPCPGTSRDRHELLAPPPLTPEDQAAKLTWEAETSKA